MDPIDVARPVTLDAAALARPERAPGKTARDFEALFATLLVKEMRRTLPEGFFGAGATGDVYGGWLDQCLGEALAKRGALHLSRNLDAHLGNQA